MRKTKKISVAKPIVIAVLALLLVVSMICGITGAWFTDTATGSGNTTLDFGNVSLSLTTPTNGTWNGKSGDYVVPGSTCSGTITLTNNGNQDLYYGIKAATIELYKDTTKITTHPITIAFYSGTSGTTAITTMGSEAAAGEIAELVKDGVVNCRFVINIPTTLGNTANTNTYAGETYTVKYTITFGAVQKANMTGNTPDAKKEAAWGVINGLS